MAESRKYTCICQAIKNCVTQGAGQNKLIFAEGVKLSVNSGETSFRNIFHMILFE